MWSSYNIRWTKSKATWFSIACLIYHHKSPIHSLIGLDGAKHRQGVVLQKPSIRPNLKHRRCPYELTGRGKGPAWQTQNSISLFFLSFETCHSFQEFQEEDNYTGSQGKHQHRGRSLRPETPTKGLQPGKNPADKHQNKKSLTPSSQAKPWISRERSKTPSWRNPPLAKGPSAAAHTRVLVVFKTVFFFYRNDLWTEMIDHLMDLMTTKQLKKSKARI